MCRRTLTRLEQLGAIEHLQRRIGGIRAGSAAYIWRLAASGDALLRREQPGRPRDRRKEPSLWFLQHRLTVAATHLAVRDAAETVNGELLQVQGEPACWRSYVAPSGSHEILKPDLYAVTAVGDWEDHWFIEVDLDTESLPTLLRKCQQYLAYRASGQEQQRLGVFPKVLWVVPDEQRADRLAVAIQEQLPSELFRIGTETDLQRIIPGGAA